MKTMEVNLFNYRLEKDINKVISKETLKDGNLKTGNGNCSYYRKL